MFAKSLAVAVVLAFTLQANAHCAIEPALGVKGTAVRNDVQRPSSASPCGTINVAAAVPTSSAVPLTNGAFTVTALNFNAGEDGSRQVTAKVDTTATGKTFATTATITTNGDLAPTNVGPQTIKAALPAGTKCTGGADGASCLVSFTTAAGFGNCVLVTQGAGGAATNTTGANSSSAAVPPAKTSAAASRSVSSAHSSTEAVTPTNTVKSTTTATSSAVADNSTTTGAPVTGGCNSTTTKKTKGKSTKKAAGTRRARALRASLEAREDETAELSRRNDAAWVRWAA